ncbi:DUF1194 domain-containing protein [Microvirga sp. P5_D2]
MRCPKALHIMVLVAGLSMLAPAWQRAPPDVDLALILAVDVSLSMDPGEQQLQRQGYVEAFRSSPMHQAIQAGMLGRIAVTYVEWAGARPRFQRIVVPWSILETSDDSLAFADRLAHAPIQRASGTSISQAIDFSMALFASAPVQATRRVIDISGDGSNNQGRLVTEARDEALARGVTINGLPILLRGTDRRESALIDAYYRDCIIGGAGAFMIPVRDPQQFQKETRAKIIREISGWDAPDAMAQPAQLPTRTDCDTSESIWDDFAPDSHTPVIGLGQNL